MVNRSNSSWSLSPETIMNHHYRMTKGIKPVVDTSPPYSMYNSPISVHYIPKRASSADAAKRSLARLPRPQRELAEFVASHSLKLPLHLTNSRNDMTKPKLLENRNYQPPRKKNTSKPAKPASLPQMRTPPLTEVQRPSRNHEIDNGIDLFNMFKDAVYSSIIDRDVFSDSLIVDTVETEMERWIGRISWDNLEYLREEIYIDLGISSRTQSKKSIRSPDSLGDSASSSSGSSSGSSSSSRRSRSKSSKSSNSSSSAASSASESATSSSRNSEETEDDLSSIE